MVKYVVCILLLLLAALNIRAAQDTLTVYFDTDKVEMRKQSQAMLDSLFYNDAIEVNKTITIIGYADYVGSTEYNASLSHNRAQYVYDYLLGMGVVKNNIKQYAGKGEVGRDIAGNAGYATDRRVDIVLETRNKKQQLIAKPKPATPPKTNTPATVHNLPELKKGETLVLKNIYFYAGRHVVRDESLQELENLYNVLLEHPTMKIQVEGHICCIRSGMDALDEDTFELSLSENRAKFICAYLVNKGISAKRLSYMGFGRTRPIIADEKTDADGDVNRRVEIRVLEP
jgi:Outer membrane protein and related peptidoglycan-associated (lipo)proteins